MEREVLTVDVKAAQAFTLTHKWADTYELKIQGFPKEADESSPAHCIPYTFEVMFDLKDVYTVEDAVNKFKDEYLINRVYCGNNKLCVWFIMQKCFGHLTYKLKDYTAYHEFKPKNPDPLYREADKNIRLKASDGLHDFTVSIWASEANMSMYAFFQLIIKGFNIPSTKKLKKALNEYKQEEEL